MTLIVVVVATGRAGPPLDDSRCLLLAVVALSSAHGGGGMAGVILSSHVMRVVADDRPRRESRGPSGGRRGSAGRKIMGTDRSEVGSWMGCVCTSTKGVWLAQRAHRQACI
jgi:hypothetical protein